MQPLCRFRLTVLLAISILPVRMDSSAAEAASAPVYFVATSGNDGWSGEQPVARSGRTDGPFAGIPRALRASREWKEKPGNAAMPVTILVRGGTHFLNEPLVLTPADSRLVLAAYHDEKPVLSGGRAITGWKEEIRAGRKLWSADVPRGDAGWVFREFWVNGRRAVRSRHPNRGYLKIAETPDKTPQWTQGHTRFRFRENDLKSWPSVTNAEVVVMARWVESRLPVAEVNEADRLIRFSKRSVFELEAGDLYYLEGAFEALDEPGEWYFDPASSRIYYIPRKGEDMRRAAAVVPVLTQVMRMEGKPAEGNFISGLQLRGLTFAHSEWCFPGNSNGGQSTATEVGGFAQAAIGVPGSVWGEGVRGAIFSKCTFCQSGNYGLELARGCQSNHVIGCEFANLGGGGLKIGEQGFSETESEQTRANEIEGCHIHDGGKMFHSAIGVWIGQSPDNRITHNLIHDFYYTGISIGWTWGYGRAVASNNLVAFNHVHHIGIQSDHDGPILSDMGGIYTLGKQPGTRIINNLWHDMAATRYGGWGIYLDEGSSGIVVSSNVVFRTTHGGFHQHYGETNVLCNNIFAFGRDQQLQRSRVEPHLSFTFETNIVYFDSGTLLASEWADDHFVMDYNVFYDARPGAKADSWKFGKGTLKQWQRRGHDLHSFMIDPAFAAPRKNNFRLKSGSAALKLGFRPVDLSQVPLAFDPAALKP